MRLTRAMWVGAVGLMLTACGLPADEVEVPTQPRAEASSQEVTTTGSCVRRQSVPHLSSAERIARLDAFIARNGAAWDVARRDYVVDLVSGDVASSYRADVVGPATNPTPSDAVDASAAFIAMNADLLGVTPTMTGGLQYSVRATAPMELGGGFAWAVTATGVEFPPGFAGIVGAENRVHLVVYVGIDGEVRYFSSFGERFPLIELCTTGLLSPGAPEVIDGVLGHQLEYHLAGPYVLNEVHAVLGPVQAADITGTRARVTHEGGAGSTELRLAYEVSVMKAGYSATFLVDAVSGEDIDGPFVQPAP